MILLTPDQIPRFWEVIKFAAIKSNYIEEEFKERYLNRLLYQLLSGKAQCFIRLDKDRKLQMIGLTKIIVDDVIDDKTLFAIGLYSFEKVSNEIWLDDVEELRRFALASKCKSVSAWTVNSKVVDLLKGLGFEDRFKVLTLNISGGV